MRYVTNIFLKGLGAVLPVVLTLYLIYWIGSTLENLLRPVIVFATPRGYYWPGIGLGVGVVLLFCVGLIVDAWIVRRLFRLGESLLERIPLVKSVYGGLRDFMTYFARMQNKQDLQTVVAVRLGETRLIGFITGEEEQNGLPGNTGLSELVSVYLPMSYQIGGYTVYVRRENLEPIDMPVEDAMRVILTAGLSQGKKKPKKPLASNPHFSSRHVGTANP